MLVRFARRDDVTTVNQLVRDLARYERAAHEATASDAQLAEALFGENPHVFCHVVEIDDVVVGFALWFRSYSTWTGTSGLYLEDLYVQPEYRGLGFGLALMRALARVCVNEGLTRFEWSVLDWNEPSIDFYLRLGAQALDEWTRYRLSHDALANFARRED
ncbi:MAG: GNAT family N-acetyltransferase [Acidobacteriota bacterium]|nr:GNAT family N-acetyltransferase [Acidobacteriota bacterium]